MRSITFAAIVGLALVAGCKKKDKGGATTATAGDANPSAAPEPTGPGAGTTAPTPESGLGQTGCLTKLTYEHPKGDLILKKECGPVTVEGEVTIDAKLTIEPGVTVSFADGAGLWIGYSGPGSLIATGTKDAPITFTAAGDKVPGFWQGIVLGGSSRRSQLEHVVIEYAGSKGDENGASLDVAGKDVSLKNVTVRNGKGVGLRALEPEAAFVTIAGSTFQNLSLAAARLAPANLAALGANTYDAKATVQIQYGDLTQSATLRAGTRYQIMGNLEVNRGSDTAASPVLTIEPGVVVEVVSGAELGVGYANRGTLKAVGTADKPIRFTGVDKTKAAWKGLVLYPNASDIEIQHAIVEYADSGEQQGAIQVQDGAQGTIKQVSFEHLDGVGLSSTSSAKVKTEALTAKDAKAAEWKQPP